jgi:hypothetical protein
MTDPGRGDFIGHGCSVAVSTALRRAALSSKPRRGLELAGRQPKRLRFQDSRRYLECGRRAARLMQVVPDHTPVRVKRHTLRRRARVPVQPQKWKLAREAEVFTTTWTVVASPAITVRWVAESL